MRVACGQLNYTRTSVESSSTGLRVWSSAVYAGHGAIAAVAVFWFIARSCFVFGLYRPLRAPYRTLFIFNEVATSWAIKTETQNKTFSKECSSGSTRSGSAIIILIRVSAMDTNHFHTSRRQQTQAADNCPKSHRKAPQQTLLVVHTRTHTLKIQHTTSTDRKAKSTRGVCV